MRANTIAASQSVAVACFETTRTTYATGSNPQGVDAGDLDNDGDIDLVTGNAGTNNVSVFMNQGDGTFAAKVDYAAAPGSYSITIADLNGDGFKDIVTVGAGGEAVRGRLQRQAREQGGAQDTGAVADLVADDGGG